jgi:hypothetical protein
MVGWGAPLAPGEREALVGYLPLTARAPAP